LEISRNQTDCGNNCIISEFDFTSNFVQTNEVIWRKMEFSLESAAPFLILCLECIAIAVQVTVHSISLFTQQR
jgi:hypothetical protein